MKQKFTKCLIALAMLLLPALASAQSFADMVGDNPNYVLGADPVKDATLQPIYAGTCKYFYFQDGCDTFVPIGFVSATNLWGQAGNGTETSPQPGHTFKGGTYSSAYLPCMLAGQPTTGLTTYLLTGITFDTTTPGVPRGEATMSDDVATSTYAANTPYFVYADADVQLVVGGESGVPPTQAQKVVYDAGGKITSIGALSEYANILYSLIPELNPTDNKYNATWSMYGTTEHIDNATAAAWGAYGLSGGEFHPVVTSKPTGYLSAFRAFLAPDDPVAAAKVNLSIVFKNNNGSTTDINGVSIDGNVNAPIYTIDGKYVGTSMDNLERGIYIVNGKKIAK